MARKTSARGTLVVNASPSRVRQALRLLDAQDRLGDLKKVRMAIRLYDMIERFFRNGGRFRIHKRKAAAPAARKRAKPAKKAKK